jgi:hypothetical protein
MKTDQSFRQNKNIPIKILLAVISIWLICDVIIFHMVSSLIFWIMAIIEIGIGIIWSKTYFLFRREKRYTHSNFWWLPLTVIGIGTPIIVYFLLPSLRRIDAALIAFFIAMDASSLYYSKIKSKNSSK